MSQRWHHIALYTARTRKPLTLGLYRYILKSCKVFTAIDMPTGKWLATEMKLAFRRNKDLKQIDDIIQAYEKGVVYKSMLKSASDGNIESQKELIKEGYGQKGLRKIDFLAIYCWENNLDFGEYVKYYSHGIPLPKEYVEYKENNTGREEMYEGLLGPNYDFKTLYKQNEGCEKLIEQYVKLFDRKHQLASVERSLQERRETIKTRNKIINKTF